MVGLGNPLMGDDGVGCHVASALRDDPRLPRDVAVVVGEVYLLAHHDLLRGRAEILFLDALLDPAPTGTLIRLSEPDAWPTVRSGAHAPDVLEALGVLLQIDPALRETPLQVLGIAIHHARAGDRLSPELSRAAPGLLEAVLEILAHPTAAEAGELHVSGRGPGG